MVGIKKTYFNDKSDDDWKYKIRCCKVITSFAKSLDGKRDLKKHEKFKEI